MRQLDDPQTLGASLSSIAVLAGVLAWALGWFSLDMPNAPMRGAGGDAGPWPGPIQPPQQVVVSVLPPLTR